MVYITNFALSFLLNTIHNVVIYVGNEKRTSLVRADNTSSCGVRMTSSFLRFGEKQMEFLTSNFRKQKELFARTCHFPGVIMKAVCGYGDFFFSRENL